MNLRRFAAFSALATAPLAAQSSYLDHLVTQWSHTAAQKLLTRELNGDGVLDMISARNGAVRVGDGASRRAYEVASIAQGFGIQIAAVDLGPILSPLASLAVVVASAQGLSFYDSTLQSILPYVPFPAGLTFPRGLLPIQADGDPEYELVATFGDGIRLLDFSSVTPTWSTIVGGLPATDGAGTGAYVRETANGPRVGVCKVGAPLAIHEYDLMGNMNVVMPLPQGTKGIDDARMVDGDRLLVSAQLNWSPYYDSELWMHDFALGSSTRVYGSTPNVRYPAFSSADIQGVLNMLRTEWGVDEQVQRLDLATMQATPIIQASAGTGLRISSQPTANFYPGHTPGFHLYRANVGLHEFYSLDPVDTQTFDRLVPTGSTLTIDVRVPTTAAGGLVVPLFSFEVPQWIPSPFGTLAFMPDFATGMSIDLMGWQVAPANGELTFTMTVPSGPAGYVWPVSFGHLWFAPNGQTGGNQHGCTTSILTQ